MMGMRFNIETLKFLTRPWGRVSAWRALIWSYMDIKGILHQKIFYRLNLIFWIVMGCGLACFEAQHDGVSRRSTMGFRGAATLIKHFSDFSFRAVPRGPVWLPGTWTSIYNKTTKKLWVYRQISFLLFQLYLVTIVRRITVRFTVPKTSGLRN